MKQEVKIGQTDYTVLILIRDTAGAPKTGLTNVSAGLDVCYTRVETDNDVVLTAGAPVALATPALTDVHLDWGFLQVDATNAPGLYRLDIADGVFATGAWSAVVSLIGTGLDPVHIEFILVPSSPYIGVQLDPAQASITFDHLTVTNELTLSGDVNIAEEVALAKSLAITGTTTLTGHVLLSDGLKIAAPSAANRDGLEIIGKGTGHGIKVTGGGTSGNGLTLIGGATNGLGFYTQGTGSGDGLRADGGATGNGFYGVGSGDGHGMLLTGAGAGEGLSAIGGATGHGFNAQAGATSGDGIRALSPTSGNGLSATGGGTGHGVAATSGAGATGNGVHVLAISTDGTGMHLEGSGAYSGMLAKGDGAGAGIYALGGATGNGIQAKGGPTSGDGIHAEALNTGNGVHAIGFGVGAGITATGGLTGNGIESVGGGTSGHGLYAKAAGTGNGLDCHGGGVAGDGINAIADNDGDGIDATGATNGNGMILTGLGTGSGMKSTGGATGPGMLLTGGGNNANADGLRTVAGGALALDIDSVVLSATLADTNELQGDWVNTGRLDAILDIIAADTTTDIPATITTMQGNITTIMADTDLLDDVAGGLADIHTDVGTAITQSTNAAGDALAAHTAIDLVHTDVDSIKTITDNLPSGIKKNTALTNFEFYMVLAIDHISPALLMVVDCQRSIDGAAFANCNTAIATEVSAGVYKLNLAASDLNGDVITFKFTEATCDTRMITIKTSI